MAYNGTLRIDLESDILAPTSYLVIRVMFLSSTDPTVRTDVTTLVSLSTANGNAIIYNSTDLERPLLYGVSDGSDTITATIGAASGTKSITVDSSWDYDINENFDMDGDSFKVPYAKTSGYNKGRKRVNLDTEEDDQTDVMSNTTTDTNKPYSIGVMPDRIVVKQTFDSSTVWTTKSSGYGRWYGRKFGVVEELDKLGID